MKFFLHYPPPYTHTLPRKLEPPPRSLRPPHPPLPTLFPLPVNSGPQSMT